jgi:hypothetical protein
MFNTQTQNYILLDLFEAKSLKRRNISNGSQSPKSHTMKNN